MSDDIRNYTFFDEENEYDNSLRPADQSFADNLLGNLNISASASAPSQMEEDPELALVIAESMRMHEESMNKKVEEMSIWEEIERIERESKEKQEKQREEDKRICLEYKLSNLTPCFNEIERICKIWNRLNDMKPKCDRITKIIEKYLSDENSHSIYIYLNEDEHIDFFEILNEMNDSTKVKKPIQESIIKILQLHFLLQENSNNDNNHI